METIFQGLDAAAFGLDAGRVALIVSLTTFLRREIIDKTLGGTVLGIVNRFSPLLPVIVSLAISLLCGNGFLQAVKDGIVYGAIAAYSYRTAKVTIKGE